jgi:hypothetical protein
MGERFGARFDGKIHRGDGQGCVNLFKFVEVCTDFGSTYLAPKVHQQHNPGKFEAEIKAKKINKNNTPKTIETKAIVKGQDTETSSRTWDDNKLSEDNR